MFVAGKMVMTTGFEAATGKKVSKGVPSILWVAMGTDPDNHVRSGGWYNRKYIDVYVNKHMTGKKQPDKEKRWCLVTWNTTGDIHRKLINSSAENL